MTNTPTAVDIARQLADVLEERKIPYAIGGALAMAYYATPRATVDVDINIFLSPFDELDKLLAVLDSLEFVLDAPHTVRKTATEDGQLRGRISGIRVDVFLPAIAFYSELEQRKKAVTLLDRSIYIISAPDLLILKMMFFRRKDLADVEAMLRNIGLGDSTFVRGTLVDFVGESDERVVEWDKIVEDVRL